ncbi:uncharacterized protein PHALS_15300 [Plasmopara halstedii]|uniref:Uncharacterized protein n=1 Tax=Plasmopara halstedii TaxID=4781 RepID=A0A0P1ACD9_PLAHL|nr:uncharacterized protein PHALS_15300 [Plasmopara halstedii]CEG38300.1 hypothetical protein PHALS_15300 [Plasmopara halstedii]|eukprot:XP_024574669.1 hypothetical protein PHALS_15300 [Plasmopara halstedii]
MYCSNTENLANSSRLQCLVKLEETVYYALQKKQRDLSGYFQLNIILLAIGMGNYEESVLDSLQRLSDRKLISWQ